MNNIQKIVDKKLCTGCRSCELVCPKNCINFCVDAEGFIIPTINTDSCVKCGLCRKHCHILNSDIFHTNEKETYALYQNDSSELRESTSGGVFSVLAREILNNGGVVFGCKLDSDMVARHSYISDIKDLYYFRGSKYLQSDTLNTFSEVKEFLNKEIQVLYSGTPCQIAGLRTFLGEDRDKLITVEVICHGVPSPKLFREYIRWLEKKYRCYVKDYAPRSKDSKYLGSAYRPRLVMADGKVKHIAVGTDPYVCSFIKNELSRESCYNCKYKKEKRCSDITLGDYWGIDKANPKMANKMGVSVMLINTQKGKYLFDVVKKQVTYEVSSFKKAARFNGNLNGFSPRPEKRSYVYKDFTEKGADYVFNNTLKVRLNLKKRMQTFIPYEVKSFVKKYINY